MAFAQEMPAEQQLEELAEAGDEETEDEYDMQQLQNLKNHPLDINDPSASLLGLPLLNSLLIENLISYRALLGNFVNIYELQAVPGFTIDIIKAILPYITIRDPGSSVKNIKQRFKGGDRTIIIRPGLSSKFYARYKYQYRDLLQYGILAERDAAEKSLVDFYSFHLFARNIGIIKSFVVGDYVLNLGQGLIHWQSQAFKKTSSVMNVKRQAETIRPYHSAGEYNFQRGAAFTLKKYNLETTFFGSLRKITTNIDYDEHYGNVITSVNTSGLHRTVNELANKNNASVISYGVNVKYLFAKGHIGLNVIRYHYSIPLLKRDEPYNFFAIKGKSWSNYSVDYAYTYRNFHFFGESAIAKTGHIATINGIMASLHSSLDLAIVYRNINKGYQSVYGNAFTENTMPGNERGVYIGISLKPGDNWKIDMYTDLFYFPWLKYRVGAPSTGRQHFIQVTWKPNKYIEAYTRYRLKLKPLDSEGEHSRYPGERLLENWRTHISFQVSPSLLLRNRLELCWFNRPGSDPETGYLLYNDIICKPAGKGYAAGLRVQFFETGSYETRLYAYENDVLFSSSTPAFSGKGTRLYINIRSKARPAFLKRLILDTGFKIAITKYYNVDYQSNEAPKTLSVDCKLQFFLYSSK